MLVFSHSRTFCELLAVGGQSLATTHCLKWHRPGKAARFLVAELSPAAQRGGPRGQLTWSRRVEDGSFPEL